MSNRTLVACIVCGLIAIAFQPTSAAAATPSLAGSWQFTLTPSSPTGAAPVEIPGLATFTSNGSVVETDGSEFVTKPASTTPLPTAGTPGHGIWQLGNTPISLYVQYISLVLNPDGSLYARNITTMMLSLNTTSDQFSGTFVTDHAIGTQTKVISSGAVSGQLIPHSPLP
jgi:hypothetical protein